MVGYYLLGGDFFDKNLAYAEQMTVWREVKEKIENFLFHADMILPDKCGGISEVYLWNREQMYESRELSAGMIP